MRGGFMIDSELDPLVVSQFNTYFNRAIEWGRSKYPMESVEKHGAFARVVAFLMTGLSRLPGNATADLRSGGPSIREHCLNWALVGPNGRVDVYPGGVMSLEFDGTYPIPSNWIYEDAIRFAEAYCYRALAVNAAEVMVLVGDYSFNNDREDLNVLLRTVLNYG